MVMMGTVAEGLALSTGQIHRPTMALEQERTTTPMADMMRWMLKGEWEDEVRSTSIALMRALT